MFEGRLLGIYLAERKKALPSWVERVTAVAGRGLEGDRYFQPAGDGKRDQEVTLIETEAIDALARDGGITLAPEQLRRNLVTCDVPLNHLVGREFEIGEVVLRGVELCEPCGHLERLTVRGIQQHLRHRGGLRAEVVRGGVLRAGDMIRPRPSGKST